MYRRSRTRRILKWTGAAFSLVVLAIWVVSVFWAFGYGKGNYAFVVSGGLFIRYFGSNILASDVPGIIKDVGAQLRGSLGFIWPEATPGFLHSGIINIPFWLILLVVALPTALLWHLDRRRVRPGHCPRCGYDLTGNTSGVCSECGLKRAIQKVGSNALGRNAGQPPGFESDARQ